MLGQKKLLTVPSDVAVRGLARGTGQPPLRACHLLGTSLPPLGEGREAHPAPGLMARVAPVCFDSFLPCRLCPSGPRSV